jgi:hypothetical protein
MPADSGPLCTALLTPDAGPASLDELPLAAWCFQVQSVYESVYPGDFVVVSYPGTQVDCDTNYVYYGQSRALVAVLYGCKGSLACTAGAPTFRCPDPICLGSGRLGTGYSSSVDLCVEAGLPPLADAHAGG